MIWHVKGIKELTETLAQRTRDDLESCIGPADSMRSLPPTCYTDDDFFRVELQSIFHTGWIGVGRSDRWPEVGDYSAMDLAGVPVVIVRGDDGNLHAYANSCSHRSAQVMLGEGKCARMRCRFHFWTYGLDGCLLAAPSMGRTGGFEKGEHGLTEFALAEVVGFTFLSFEASPPPIDMWLGDFATLHEAWPVEAMVTTRRREFTVDCNWKAFAEVFNEYYHIPYVHPTSIDETYDEPDEPEVVSGAFATHFGTTAGTGGLLDGTQEKVLPVIGQLEGRLRAGVSYSWLFPNTVVAFGSDAMWLYEIYPDGPNRCHCAQVVCFPQATIEHVDFSDRVSSYYERFDLALEEDIPMLEEQHAGLRSPVARQGMFSYLEPSVAAFARWYAGQLLGGEAPS